MLSNKSNYVKFLLCSAIFVVLFCSVKDTFSQGRDRSKFQIGFIDTSGSYIDTSLFSDTTKIRGPVDSTARVNNFKYETSDEPIPSFGEFRSPLLLYNSPGVEYRVTFDSLNNVIITESFEGEQFKVPRVIPLEKYIEIRSRLEVQDQFYKIVAEKYQIDTEDDLTKLFKNITEITIPLPFASETIFGPPTINLKINGTIDITASYQRSTNNLATITSESQNQNNINFKQEVQVTTKGTVGDKLTVDADWNSQRTFEFENQLKLKYTGYPDEVIQSIEAGNVSLITRSNLIGSTQALFGVKAEFKLGPLTLTTIASQKKSEQKKIDITGGSVETPFDISIYDYAETNYLLDENWGSYFTSYYTTGISPIDITDIQVWVYAEPNNPNKRSVYGSDTLFRRPVGGYVLVDSTTAIQGHILIGNFVRLDPSEYTVNRYAGYITLNGNLQQLGKDAIAVAYKYNNDSTNETNIQVGDFINEIPAGSKVKLRLLRYENQKPPDQDTNYTRLWNRMLKNIYNLGVRNVKNDPSNLVFNIYYNEPGQPPISSYTGPGPTGKSYLNLVGLDHRINGNASSNVPDGDNYFDFFPNNTIDLNNGNIIFPDLRPFSTVLTSKGVDTSFIGNNDKIYTSSKTTVQNSGTLKFNLKGSAKGDASSRYSLGFNLVENSVKVFNGTNELAAGIDYSIDYSTGELVIINASALVAGANLKITYETNDLFQLASKTLIGTRAELQFNKTSYLGFTLINLKQQTLNNKIRIGEEPTNNTIIGFDASTDIKTNFLTKLVNKIPGYNTKEESILNFKGEVAFMLPDPNTLKSIIPGDNGEAVAYIDDFEGVKKTIPLGLNPLSWTLASIPYDNTLVPGVFSDEARDSLMSRKRGRLNWYNLLNNVPIIEVYPNRQTATTQNQSLTPFVLDIKPDSVGAYNYIKKSDFDLEGVPRDKWSGVFKFINSSQTNLLDENINYIEVWMQVNGGHPRNDSSKMLIDLGSISEKIITSKLMPFNSTDQNINYHTEDRNGSGQLDVGEDNGIDGQPNSVESQYYGFLDAETGGDPSRDNYSWSQNSNVYTSFNGTEQNATNLTEAKRLDTEDLNNNGNLDLINNYFEYVIPLDSASFTNHPFIAGGGNAGWYQFIIPLDEWKRTVGANVSFTNIQYARVWFKGFDQQTQIKIVDFNLVGNQWVKSNKSDTTYTVSVVNIEDNSNIYSPPVEGLRQKDQTQVDQNVLSNEQSISLDVSNLLPGQAKYIFKSYTTRPLDLINYKILKVFVNGDSSFTFTNADKYDASVVVRIGNDTSNYYEYRAPIRPDQRPHTPWTTLNEVVINLSDLTAVKQKVDSTGLIHYEPVVNGPPGSVYGVIGSPSIRDVRQISLGVYNNNNDPIITRELTGSVWFDEMRVIKTNNASGYAFTLSAGLKIADLATLNFSYNKTDPNFHSLESSFGNNTTANSWEFSGLVNAHKLLNALLSKYVSVKFKDFFTIPISFSHQEILDKPKYLPATDIDLETAANNKYAEILTQTGDANLAAYYADRIRVAAQTLRIANRFSITGMKFTFPGENFFVKQLLNKLEVSFVRNSYIERSPSLESKYAWDMNGSVGLSSDLDLMNTINLKIGRFLPFGEEFKEARMYFFFPFMPLAPLFTNNIALSGSFSRRRGDEKLRSSFDNSPTSRQFDANRGFTMNWKFIENWIIDMQGDYSFRSGSDLTYLETTNDSLRLQRNEAQIFDDIFFNNGLINWGKDLDYSQTVSFNPKFNIPGLREIVDLTSSYRVIYGWRASQFNNSQGSNVGYTTDLQATAYLKLNNIFNFFKPKNNILGGSQKGYQNQDPQDILKILGTFIPDQVSVTYAQSKQLQNPAILGRPGFGNFWMQLGAKENLGPSRMYQLGWITDPGKRVPLTTLVDNNNLTNTYTFNTFITPIFPNNLKLNFTYKTGTATINALTYNSDSLGLLGLPVNSQENRTITRPSFFVSLGETSSEVGDKLGSPNDPVNQAQIISDNFEKKLVSFPFPSWTLSLTGLEKFEMFSNFAQSVTVESGYSSEYRKVLTYNGLTPEYISAQALTSGFTPLVGVNFNFKQISGGSLTASFKISKTNNYILEPSNAKLTNTATNDLAINASYTKSGFSLPIFGLSLENNLTISFSYTRTKNDPQVYSYQNFNWEANSQNGSTSTSLSPSIQYNLSRSVTMQLFYKYTKIEPTGSNLQITTRTTNEAGLNIRLQIQ